VIDDPAAVVRHNYWRDSARNYAAGEANLPSE